MSDVDDLDAARLDLGLSVYDLWVLYIGAGGHHDAFTLRRYLAGNHTLDDHEHDHIVLALNEAYEDAGDDHPIPYRRP
jgi:hypothetical protein